MTEEFILIRKTEVQHIKQQLDLILTHLEVNPGESANPLGRWITEQEAQQLLKKKGTTLWKMRRKGLLEWTKVENRVYYAKDSILALLERNRKIPVQ